MARYRGVRSKHKKQHSKPKKAPITTISTDNTPVTQPPNAANVTNFLALPGELRNRIYRMTLISHDKIRVAKGQFAEPNLLLACRQIRAEAVPIYYLENRWLIDYPDWDYSLFERFNFHILAARGIRDTSKMEIRWENTGSHKNKANLLEFARALHENKKRLQWLTAGQNTSVLVRATVGVMKITKAMRANPWDQVEQVLEIYLQQVSKQSSGWSWE